MKVSVILTIKNEAASLPALLESLAAQSRPADEVIVCDGGSADGSAAILSAYRGRLPLRLFKAPGSNISQGRNRAIAAAAGPIIASTDAGVRLTPDWLAELVRPIEEGGAAAAAGWFRPAPQTDFETVMGATVLPDLADIDPAAFLPSSRSAAFLKSAWQAAGGYPEWLDYGEDLVFDLALRGLYGPFPFAPAAVAHFRPRPSLAAFGRQYYRYARGDGKAGLWPRRHAVRYLTYFFGLPALLAMAARGRLLGWLGLLAAAGLYCRRPAQRLWPLTAGWPPGRRLAGLALIPVILLVGDLAKMAGYPAGVCWRRTLGRPERL
ncbi:MAG: glycosyltransferase [Candidatus Promineifilaceae bacterium]